MLTEVSDIIRRLSLTRTEPRHPSLLSSKTNIDQPRTRSPPGEGRPRLDKPTLVRGLRTAAHPRPRTCVADESGATSGQAAPRPQGPVQPVPAPVVIGIGVTAGAGGHQEVSTDATAD